MLPISNQIHNTGSHKVVPSFYCAKKKGVRKKMDDVNGKVAKSILILMTKQNLTKLLGIHLQFDKQVLIISNK